MIELTVFQNTGSSGMGNASTTSAFPLGIAEILETRDSAPTYGDNIEEHLLGTCPQLMFAVERSIDDQALAGLGMNRTVKYTIALILVMTVNPWFHFHRLILCDHAQPIAFMDSAKAPSPDWRRAGLRRHGAGLIVTGRPKQTASVNSDVTRCWPGLVHGGFV